MMVRFSAKSASRAMMTAVLSASTGTSAFIHLTPSLTVDYCSFSKASQVFRFSTVVEGTQQQKASDAPKVLRMSGSDDDDGEQPITDGEEEPFPFKSSTVKMDDGGSDLTDRFKYKVHALMGDYNPKDGVADDERQDGHIFNGEKTAYSFCMYVS
jgi:hypothetical protein